ncbi:MAG: molybdopterin-guanine dinucleotide biosynthesis protein B [Anaerolineae bacterium]
MTHPHPPIVAIIGKSKSGKTTLIEKLIAHFRQRGYRVATIKHHFHTDKTLDTPGKDTWRHAQAGAEQVVIISPLTTVTFSYPPTPPTPQQVAARLAGFDLILAEGFSQAALPAIEVLRAERNAVPISDPAHRLALASDFQLPGLHPVFDLNDVEGIAALIEQQVIGL